VKQIWIVTDERYLRQRMPMALIDELARRDVLTKVVVAEETLTEVAAGRPPMHDMKAGDVVLARTRHRYGLTLLRSAERAGLVSPVPWQAVHVARDKVRAAERLVDLAIPTPRTWVAPTPSSLAPLPRDAFPLLLKPRVGDNARGIVMVRAPRDLDDIAWDDGVAFAQSYEEVGGIDLKLYVIARRVWAVERPSPLLGTNASEVLSARVVQPDDLLHDLSMRCADGFGLPLCGIDIVLSKRGPLVVDVNEFPNYTGIPHAPAVAADFLAEHITPELRT
jgi:ribosomal protein S6--L-glutamate ligase